VRYQFSAYSLCSILQTPSGILHSLDAVTAAAEAVNALLLVDMVSSAFGVPINITKSKVDIALLGSQKCLSLPPDISAVMVSSRAWQRVGRTLSRWKLEAAKILMVVEEVKYAGFDALLPFHFTDKTGFREYPYTMNFAALVALQKRLEQLESIGLEVVYQQVCSS